METIKKGQNLEITVWMHWKGGKQEKCLAWRGDISLLILRNSLVGAHPQLVNDGQGVQRGQEAKAKELNGGASGAMGRGVRGVRQAVGVRQALVGRAVPGSLGGRRDGVGRWDGPGYIPLVWNSPPTPPREIAI